jgi:hypothetical protein
MSSAAARRSGTVRALPESRSDIGGQIGGATLGGAEATGGAEETGGAEIGRFPYGGAETDGIGGAEAGGSGGADTGGTNGLRPWLSGLLGNWRGMAGPRFSGCC